MTSSTNIARGKKSRLRKRLNNAISVLGAAAAAIAVATVSSFLHFNLSTVGSAEFLLVVLAALYWGLVEATILSIVAVICLDYLFIPPLFVLSISDPQNWISLATFEITALLVSRLSSQVKLHVAGIEVERRRTAKLYELSRAVLLIDGSRAPVDQLSALIQEIMTVGQAHIWVIYDPDIPGRTIRSEASSAAAHNAFLLGQDSEDPILGNITRIVRIGTTSIGAMILESWENDSLLADSIASLVALVVERSRAIQKENRAEAERNTEQLRTAVLDGLAHGFKTPLTAIQTASSGLLAIDTLDETQAELVSIIDEQATLLGQLTTRLLQTAALESRQVKLRRIEVSLLSLIDHLIEQCDQPSRSRINISAADSLKPVFLDPQLIELALMQLLDNALKYSPISTVVEVSIAQNDAETSIAISNQGSPIRPEERDRIFERFYRGVGSAHGPSGTGLGLSIVRKAAEAHDGRVWVDSDSRITRFSLTIPRIERAKYE